ncbi:MAG: metal-sensitive transcriptional regulator [Armatimonadota bacterium]
MITPDPKTYEDARKRLNRIAGQITGLQKMVEEERYCVEILTQVSAVRAALDGLGLLMLIQHLEGCVYGNGEENGQGEYATRQARTEELRTALNRFLK